jgi:hypothetical protein
VITNDARQEDVDYNSNLGWDCDTPNTCDITDGLIGCPADGLGYANSKKSNTVNYFGEWQVGPGRYCSPRHRDEFFNPQFSSQMASYDMRAMSARPIACHVIWRNLNPRFFSLAASYDVTT